MATIIDDRTPNRNYPVPNVANNADDDAARIAQAFSAIDLDVRNLLTSVSQKAALVHTHEMESINGLVSALAGKAASDHRHALSDLTDVDTTGVANGLFLKRVGAKWVAAPIDAGSLNAAGAMASQNNLSEVTPATARANLSVYSRAEADAALGAKMDKAGGTMSGDLRLSLAATPTRGTARFGSGDAALAYDGATFTVTGGGLVIQVGNINVANGSMSASYMESRGDAYTRGRQSVGGELVVGLGQTSSLIRMADSDQGDRSVHNNSGYIGFLNTSGQWVARVDDNGSLWTLALGDIGARIEQRASDYAGASGTNAYNGAVAIANDRVHRIRMTGFGQIGLSSNATQDVAPAVLTGSHTSGVANTFDALTYRTLQQFVPVLGGWVNCLVE